MNRSGYRTRWLGVIAAGLLSLAVGHVGNGAPVVAKPQATPSAPSSSAPSKQMPGFIRDWYGFSKLPYDGAGQTVAIVGTGDYLAAGSDLAVFINSYGTGSMHGLAGNDPCTVTAGPHPCFERVKAPAVSTQYPDLYWSGGTHYHIEAASDVQWAHVVAPGADILFVDAATPTPDDVMGAIDVAVAQGSSVVSISLGWEQTADDAARETHFTNHPGVVFVAASGDNDYGGNQLYPAASPNVLAVGGTTLKMVGTKWAESAWGRFTDTTNHTGPIGSTGGLSRFDAIPAYQQGFHTGTNRGVPDVAYAADWVGFPTYVLGQYYTLGGTSVGAPQWAALVALANQARSGSGQPPLTGVAPFYEAAQTETYTGNYRDIVDGMGACMNQSC
ncbi:MAG: hypothetical protein JWN15_279, partial [Firmicutes bacterium]|nr:hypothetical protein [Bacillota bacterium]